MHVDRKQHVSCMTISYRSLPTDGRSNAGVDHTHIATRENAHITVDRGHATVTEVTEKIRVIDHSANVSNRRWTNAARTGGRK